ncbi:Plasmodium exported protein, unknown function [Plasmodium malariae]|uniref:Uncharacterized protein n=1 Tax=Plasmodium malariae TaxID=5858 RepID=A0A1C3L266_PLAMA|nr:Plasmodium exported protein, unknown function [Plasmodium malariae]
MTRENNSILNNTKLSYNEYVTKRLIARNYVISNKCFRRKKIDKTKFFIKYFLFTHYLWILLYSNSNRSHYDVYDEAKGINGTLILRPYRLLVTVDYVEIQEPEETNSEPNEKKKHEFKSENEIKEFRSNGEVSKDHMDNVEKSSNYNDKNDDTDLYRRNLDSLTGKSINVEINDDILKNKCSLLKFYMGDEANYTTDKDPFSKENIEKRKKRKIITIIEYFHRGIAFIAMIAFNWRPYGTHKKISI